MYFFKISEVTRSQQLKNHPYPALHLRPCACNLSQQLSPHFHPSSSIGLAADSPSSLNPESGTTAAGVLLCLKLVSQLAAKYESSQVNTVQSSVRVDCEKRGFLISSRITAGPCSDGFLIRPDTGPDLHLCFHSTSHSAGIVLFVFGLLASFRRLGVAAIGPCTCFFPPEVTRWVGFGSHRLQESGCITATEPRPPHTKAQEDRGFVFLH